MTAPKGRVVHTKQEPFDVDIGRGVLSNPIQANRPCPVCSRSHRRNETIACFERYARSRVATDPQYRQQVRELHQRTLGCPCALGARCHGEVLLLLASELAAGSFVPPNPIQLFPTIRH